MPGSLIAAMRLRSMAKNFSATEKIKFQLRAGLNADYEALGGMLARGKAAPQVVQEHSGAQVGAVWMPAPHCNTLS